MARLRVIVHGTMQGDAVQNCFGVSVTGVSSASQASNVAAVVSAAWDDNILAQQSDNYSKSRVTAQDIDNPEYYADLSTPGTGGNPGPPLPAFVTINARLQTGLRGRAYNGRTGITGLVIGDIDTAQPAFLTNTRRAEWNGYIAGFRNDIVSSPTITGGQLVILSFVENGAPRPGGAMSTVVTEVDVAQRLGTRRSRND